MDAHITSEADLERVVGKVPAAINLKVIDHLDPGARRWLGASPIAFATFVDGTGIFVTLAGGAPGFASADHQEVRLPAGSLDDGARVRPGDHAGLLFLIPTVKEMLRINGTVTTADGHGICVRVEECYGHCGKAIIRSDFWSAPPLAGTNTDVGSLASRCRFTGLGTMSSQGQADLSPKGDPAGAMVRLAGAQLWFADRPGNRRVDSFRNIVGQPRVAAVLIQPGSARVVRLSGTARISTDAAVREQFTVQGKTPALVTCIEVLVIEMYESPALVQSGVWTPTTAPSGTDVKPAELMVNHVKLNKNKGIMGKLVRLALSIPGAHRLVNKGLEKDYRDRLY